MSMTGSTVTDREAWLVERQSGVGASEAAADEFTSIPPLPDGKGHAEPTGRQRALFLLIFDSVLREGRQPSVRQLMRDVGLTSPNGVMCHLRALDSKGWILLANHSSRSIVFLKGPDGKPFRGFSYPPADAGKGAT